ncbi:sensor histidine kinase [Actinoallomurus bryophytorum]|uniref:histidine kinase n=2 Tax=Actinoallomurus bryophytorum TaxID=1490222 RepID=A0A543BTK7_9ACTN|nr:signal transduction histidine kinase [Actinoallomurus bryophytorum]
MFPIVLLAIVAARLFGTWFIVPVLAMLLPVGLLRRRPSLALGLMLFVLVAMVLLNPGGGGGYPSNLWFAQVAAADIAVGFIAANQPKRTSGIAFVSTLIVESACAMYYTTAVPGLTPAAFMILALVVVWLIGRSIGQRREYGEAQRAQAAVQAVQAERLRIARELHDMIAHSIGVIAIQAGVGGRVIDTQPAEARNALNAIEDTSRETLAGLRRMLGTLRQADQGSAPLDPTPGLADLDGLVGRSLAAGVRVEVRRLGQERALPADIDLSAFRIVQEALTNVIRHAGARDCRVVLDYRDEELRVEVTDDGRGTIGAPVAGYGIAGMRERAALLHGHFSAGPRADGGFGVSARLPVPAESR